MPFAVYIRESTVYVLLITIGKHDFDPSVLLLYLLLLDTPVDHSCYYIINIRLCTGYRLLVYMEHSKA
jgi:hypothetical protein